MPNDEQTAKLFSRLEVGDCWEWTRALDKDGYGKFGYAMSGGEMRHVRVHRMVWEILVGPIPSGMVLDHLCKNRKCANPDHLEIVTPGENTRRGHSPNRAKRQCAQGHAELYRRRAGKRECRECARLRELRRRGVGPQPRKRTQRNRIPLEAY